MVQSGHVGQTAVIPDELDGIAAHALIMFQKKKNRFSADFINYFFQTNLARNMISIKATGNTIKHILASEMKKFRVSSPTLNEQNEISRLLITIDRIIELLDHKLQLLNSVKQSLLQKMFI